MNATPPGAPRASDRPSDAAGGSTGGDSTDEWTDGDSIGESTEGATRDDRVGDDQTGDDRSPAVELDGVTFGYAERPVVEDVSLTVEHGEFLGLVGPNGSGKSTLLRLMLGLHRPDRGTARLFGEPAGRTNGGGRVGYVAQGVATAAAEMPVTVAEVVALGRYPQVGLGRFGDDDRAAVTRALERVGIAALRDRRIGRLSGGQRQRAFIARALAAETDLLALDEPAVGVDAESREAFYGLLRELNADGLTVVLIEHDVGVVTDRADRIACLNRELTFHGDSEAFAGSGALAAAYGTNQRVLGHDHP